MQEENGRFRGYGIYSRSTGKMLMDTTDQDFAAFLVTLIDNEPGLEGSVYVQPFQVEPLALLA